MGNNMITMILNFLSKKQVYTPIITIILGYLLYRLIKNALEKCFWVLATPKEKFNEYNQLQKIDVPANYCSNCGRKLGGLNNE